MAYLRVVQLPACMHVSHVCKILPNHSLIFTTLGKLLYSTELETKKCLDQILLHKTLDLVCTVELKYKSRSAAEDKHRTSVTDVQGDRATVTCSLTRVISYLRYGDGAGNTTEENSSVFSLTRMR